MADALFTIGIVCFVLAGILFIATIVIFFKARILSVIAELSGKTATDTIASIRQKGVIRQHKGKSLQSILDDVDNNSLRVAGSVYVGNMPQTTNSVGSGVMPEAVDNSNSGTTLLNTQETYTTLMR